MPEWVAWMIAAVPVLTVLGGGLGALLTFRVQGRQAVAQTITAEAAHETAAAAGRKAAVDEMAELRQHWTAIISTVTADNAAVRFENAQIKSDLAALHATHKQDMLEVATKLRECETTNLALLAHFRDNQARIGAIERGENPRGRR